MLALTLQIFPMLTWYSETVKLSVMLLIISLFIRINVWYLICIFLGAPIITRCLLVLHLIRETSVWESEGAKSPRQDDHLEQAEVPTVAAWECYRWGAWLNDLSYTVCCPGHTVVGLYLLLVAIVSSGSSCLMSNSRVHSTTICFTGCTPAAREWMLCWLVLLECH